MVHRILARRYQRGLDLLVYKYPNNFHPHRLQPILLFDVKYNIHNKHLGIIAMSQVINLDRITPEQYGSRKSKAADTQSINTIFFYDLIRQKRIPATSIFSDLVLNYYLVVPSIAYLSLQRFDVPQEPILCTFTKLQKCLSQ